MESRQTQLEELLTTADCMQPLAGSHIEKQHVLEQCESHEQHSTVTVYCIFFLKIFSKIHVKFSGFFPTFFFKLKINYIYKRAFSGRVYLGIKLSLNTSRSFR